MDDMDYLHISSCPLFQYLEYDCQKAETPEGLDAAENPIWLPSSVHFDQAKFS
ncbi:Uncharacterised protein [Staphylococcus intermedius NCTC 11048]|uniref:Uncharacterized protein n=1 Tax=Staphylococcus intermedius NCTC 11048 TaxID=1141106 RepID=A0A380G736_STAIN|nr:Uncharacterised protein [Staphylococcus intermedius NCTC 11048]